MNTVDGNLRLSATVISYDGSNSKKDDFYFNGNFSNCHNTDSIQCSLEKSDNDFIFAICDSMGIDNGNSNALSAIKEVKRHHKSVRKGEFSLEAVTDKIYESIQLASNLIYSKSIVSSQNEQILTAFSSVIFDNNRAVAMNLGNNGVFLYRQGEQVELFSNIDSKKAEKLKMLGISANKSTDIINNTDKILKLAEEESKTKVKLSHSFELMEGDIILLCNSGLLDRVGRSRIESVVNSGLDTSKIASVLFQEAQKSDMSSNITIMAVRIEQIKNIAQGKRKYSQVEYDNEEDDIKYPAKKVSHLANYIIAFICVVIISGIAFMGYLIFKGSDIMSSGNSPSQETQALGDTSQSAIITDENVADDTTPTNSSIADSQTQNDNNTSDAADNNNNQSTIDNNDNTDTNNADNNVDSKEYQTYTVKQGDTLGAISYKFYKTTNKYDVIMKYNNIKKETSLYVGQELKIPNIN